jgi:hypothetical protein
LIDEEILRGRTENDAQSRAGRLLHILSHDPVESARFIQSLNETGRVRPVESLISALRHVFRWRSQ